MAMDLPEPYVGDWARVFDGPTGAGLFLRSGEEIDDFFGSSCAFAGDLDADGDHEILVGATGHDGPQGIDSGKAYLYAGGTGDLLMVFHGSAPGEQIGDAVCGVGDTNDDLYPEMLVAASEASGAAGDEAGRVYLFSGNPFDLCNRGVVNWGAQDIRNVLYLNGSTGGATRKVFGFEGQRLWGSIVKPPAGGNGKYVIHAYAGIPDYTTLTVLPKDVGTACYPFLLPAGANPLAIWNNLGKEDKIGSSRYFDGTPIDDPPRASAVFFKLLNGDSVNLPAGAVFTFQAIVIDPASVSVKSGSVSNAIILEIL
jgi:hypothetical protein